MLLAMGHAMIGLYCRSFGHVPRKFVLDIDDTFDLRSREQQLLLFNAHITMEYGFQPRLFDDEVVSCRMS